mmetsp:Transcript_34346/g.60164  ORF Transcript_34346/g.60164 Transcript_34346/m.60164 type:complete len:647 (+) Transcript_34346:1691-3631(+)
MKGRQPKPSSRPTSATDRTMEVLEAPSRKSQTKAKTKQHGTLTRVTPVRSASSSQSLPAARVSVSAHERERLKQLTTPLKLTDSWHEVKSKLDDLTEERAKAMEDLQNYATMLQSGKITPSEPIFKEISIENPEESSSFFDTALSMRSSYSDLDAVLKAQLVKIDEIAKRTEELKRKRGEDGELIVNYPADFDDIMEYAIEQDSFRRENDLSYTGNEQINWVALYRSKEACEGEDPILLEKRRKIKLLDKRIRQKEQKLKEIRSRSRLTESQSVDSYDPTFVTKGTRLRKKSPDSFKSRPSRRSETQNFPIVQRNIDNAANIKSRQYLTERLTEQEKEYLERLVESNSTALVPVSSLLNDMSISRLQEIDESLKHYVPEDKWEEKSIIYSASERSNRSKDKKSKTPSSIASSNFQAAEPKEPALQEEKERREAYQKLKRINQSLLDLQNSGPQELTEEELNKLILEAKLAIDANDSYAIKAIEYYQDKLIDTAKEIIEKIETRLDEPLALQDWTQYDKALEMYEKNMADEPLAIPEIGPVVEELDKELRELDAALRDTEILADKYEVIGKYFASPLEIEPLPEVVVPEEDIEAFIRTVEEKALNSFVPPQIEFTFVNSISAEEFPIYSSLLASLAEGAEEDPAPSS